MAKVMNEAVFCLVNIGQSKLGVADTIGPFATLEVTQQFRKKQAKLGANTAEWVAVRMVQPESRLVADCFGLES